MRNLKYFIYFITCSIVSSLLLVACSAKSPDALEQSGKSAVTIYRLIDFKGISQSLGEGNFRIDGSQFRRVRSLKVATGYQVKSCHFKGEVLGKCRVYPAGDYPVLKEDNRYNLLIVSRDETTTPPDPSTPQTGTRLRQDGTILLNGSPFFPFGFYTNARASLSQQMQTLQTFNDAGLNTLFFDPLGASADDYDLLFDEAAKQNIMLIPRFWGALGGAQEADGTWFATPDVPFVHRFKDKPALLAWALADDVQGFNDNREVIANYNTNVKSADPNHLTYITGDPGDDKATSYLESTDTVAIQTYPIPNCCTWTPALPEGAPQLSKTYWDIANGVAKTEVAGKPVIANLQAFSWDYPGHPDTVTNARWPTPQEFDNMTYQAIIAGAKGILYFTFENFTTPEIMLPQGQPELWKRVPVLTEELSRLTPALLNGKRVTFISSDLAVYGATWSLENKSYLAVVNTAEEDKKIGISLDIEPNMQLLPFSQDRAVSLALVQGQLTGFIKAGEVQLYELGNP